MNVEIWGRPGCAACLQAKSLFASNGYEVNYILVAPSNLKDFAMKFPGAKSVPQIIVNNTITLNSLQEAADYMNKE
jgi:glutaredoxin